MYHNANNYDKARPEGSEDPVPHLDKAMAEFNTALALMGASDENKYVSYAISTSTGAGSVFWHFKRALANLDDYGEEGGNAQVDDDFGSEFDEGLDDWANDDDDNRFIEAEI